MRPFLFSDNLFPECPDAVRPGGSVVGLDNTREFFFGRLRCLSIRTIWWDSI